jgi:hypothetical protein
MLPDITEVDVHSHGWEPGLIGDPRTDSVGFYVDGFKGDPRAAYVADFVASVVAGKIDLAKGASIVFWACNSDKLAKALSAALAAAGRGDVTVTGASDSVSPDPASGDTRARVDKPGSFNTYKAGNRVGSSSTRPYK